MNKANYKALLPIGVFLVLYLGLGIVFEYVLKIPMGFYNIPIVVVFLIALLVACVQNSKLNFDAKLAMAYLGKLMAIITSPGSSWISCSNNSLPLVVCTRRTLLNIILRLKYKADAKLDEERTPMM